MGARGLRVGEVAAKAGVGIDTVRFYERRGVLPPAERLRSGYRSFPLAAVDRLVFAKRLRALGFGLDEVVAFFALIDRDALSCEAAAPLFEAITRKLDEQIAQLAAMRDELAAVRARCRAAQCADLLAAARTVRRPRTARA